MRKSIINFLILTSILSFSCFLAQSVLAAVDLSINVTDISFSKEEVFKGDKIRIYARVFNLGDKDVQGFVIFSDNGKEISDPQPISVKVNTYDDVFIDWVAVAGNNNIEAKIIGTNPKDENIENNSAARENYFVDVDTDKDGIGDAKDTDDDNDGVPDDQEKILGTDSKNPDTDEDGVKDNVDVFPLDKTEWRDTNNNGIGDNIDPDADGDGLTNYDEIHKYGTNPLNPDSDSDGVQDKKETEIGTNPNKADTDGDGVIDSQDAYPLDSNKMTAGLLGVMESIFGKDFLYSSYFWLGILIVIIMLLIIYRVWRRRRRNRE